MENDDSYIGKQIGNYLLSRELGRGSYGSVYQAVHLHLNRTIAIKLLHHHRLSTKKEQNAFFQEAKILDMLKHRHVLPIIDVGIEDGLPYMMIKYAPNGSLRQRMTDHYPALLPMKEALLIISQVGQALHYAHQHYVVHRDLKPENILFNENGEALLADFGIAVMLEKGTIDVKTIEGTLPYMAPEQFDKKVSVKSDQYALACIAYELFTGRRAIDAPLHANHLVWAYRHANDEPLPPTRYNLDISNQVDAAILKALAKDRDKRHENVSAFIASMVSETRILDESELPTLLFADEPTKQAETSIESSKKTIEQWMEEGLSYYRANNLSKALEAYEQAIQLGCLDPAVFFYKGNILVTLKRPGEALEAYEQAIQLDPGKDFYYNIKGNVLRELGRSTEALVAYGQALQLSPGKYIFHKNRGDILYELRKFKEAVAAYEQAILLAPNNEMSAKAYASKAKALVRLRYAEEHVEDKALAACQKAIELDPGNPSHYGEKGNVLWAFRRNDEALKAFEQGLVLDPTDSYLQERRADILKLLGRRGKP